MRQSVKWFRKIRAGNRILGLEIFDLLLLLVIFLFVFMFSTNLIVNLAIVIGTYFFLRIYKKGKTSHWTNSIIGFLARPRTYSIRREMETELFE